IGLALVAAGPPAGASAQATPAAAPGDPAHAHFEGRTINLAERRGEARACIQLDAETYCYRSEAELEGVHASTTVRLACATALRLYDGTSFGTPVLSLTATGVVINLSSYGFDNKTSSHRVGACNSTFYDVSGGGAPTYPGNTSAG